MSKDRRPPAMTDVARLAGVSHMTVSRVLNDAAAVKPETRAKVLAAIEQLRYRPNTAARTLVTGRSSTLGVVALDTTLYGPASTLFGIEEAGRDAGYTIRIASLRVPDRESLAAAIGTLRDQGVDGIAVIAPYESAARALGQLSVGLPVVAVEGGEAGDLPVVAVDQHAGALRATRHLLSLGHETVWHIAGPQDWLEAQGREHGWRAALAEAGVAAPEVLRGDWSARSGYDQGRDLATRPGLSAVFVANDQMALGTLRALREEGIDVPGRVHVVGFDDVPEAAYYSPPLTTIRQDFAEVGRQTFGLLVDLIEGRAAPRRVIVKPELVLRESTATPD